MQNLSTNDEAIQSYKCECGLDVEMSQLPQGWSVHISRDDTSLGRPFFMDSHGTTAWDLPTAVALQMNKNQKHFTRKLLDRYMKRKGIPEDDYDWGFKSDSSDEDESGGPTQNGRNGGLRQAGKVKLIPRGESAASNEQSATS